LVCHDGASAIAAIQRRNKADQMDNAPESPWVKAAGALWLVYYIRRTSNEQYSIKRNFRGRDEAAPGQNSPFPAKNSPFLSLNNAR
jgi:hypothetical protein